MTVVEIKTPSAKSHMVQLVDVIGISILFPVSMFVLLSAYETDLNQNYLLMGRGLLQLLESE